jgi:D-lactate dehydrogenase
VHIAIFSAKPFDRTYFAAANREAGHELVFFEARLEEETAALAAGFSAVCVFVNDRVTDSVIAALARGETRLVALRSAGFNHVDLGAAQKHGLTVVRVPAYSPHAVAEHTVALILGLNRKTHRAYARVREGNFALHGLLGFDLCGKTVGIVGLGKIGSVLATLMLGFGCEVLGHDPMVKEHPGVDLVSCEELFSRADIISLHCPLTPQTRHIIDEQALTIIKRGVMLINTGRGALIDTRAVIAGLKSGKIGHLGLDVYEEEEALFSEDHSTEVIQDDVFMRLVTFPNVLITAHQAFFTHEALSAIAATTLANVKAFESGRALENEISADSPP